MPKLTDQEIEDAKTKTMMIVGIANENWAMPHKDALLLLDIFTRAVKVEHLHSSSYRHSIWVPDDDQSAPIDAATVGRIKVPVSVTENDPFTAATNAVS